ncbi:glycosyltransferase [Noviherbaspirillum aridicola]|uniref:Glycosyl transferase n=1 Tax=Noviherbaspirillum aridicola TaxID=2849687 RepID=A0ABQ4Q4N3_9BURK|nr:glycosyltransferase [Noviherbaspirillum aridicola]GIZ52148.1 glycosyl transferase [Noviherbaspirillum aridicola]
MEAKPIGVVVPYFRAPEQLERCLRSLEQQESVRTDVFVRDNSHDNILYTKAINEGLRRFCFNGSHDYVLILTQDAWLFPDCLRTLVDVIESDPRIGIAAPIQTTESGEATWFGSLQAYPWGHHAGGNAKDTPDPFDTYWANGACLLIRTAMVHEIGMLDENMRFVCSDSDYSFTARSRGWRVVAVPRARVVHSLHTSGGKTEKPAWLSKRIWEDQLYFARKWLSGDVYRQLAYEGDILTHEFVQQEVARSMSAVEEWRTHARVESAERK